MTDAISVALVAEFTPSFLPHGKTNDAIEQVQSALGVALIAAAIPSNLPSLRAWWHSVHVPHKMGSAAKSGRREGKPQP